MPTPDKRPPGQKATKLVFLWRNLKSPNCIFFYSRAGEKNDKKMTSSVFVAVVYCNRSSFFKNFFQIYTLAESVFADYCL